MSKKPATMKTAEQRRIEEMIRDLEFVNVFSAVPMVVRLSHRAAKLIAKLSRVKDLREKNAELESLFDLQWKRMGEATRLWRAAHPGKELTSPDLGALLTWLMAEIDGYKQSLAMSVGEDLQARASESHITPEDKMSEEDKTEAFLRYLTDLSVKHGIAITEDGVLFTMEHEDLPYSYRINESGHLTRA